MIAVIFEVEPKQEGKAAYLDTAVDLKPELEKIEGFVSIERFQSLSNPQKLLSLSIFEDEAAVARWRMHRDHRSAQEDGRTMLFSDYRIWIAQILRDYGMKDRAQAPD